MIISLLNSKNASKFLLHLDLQACDFNNMVYFFFYVLRTSIGFHLNQLLVNKYYLKHTLDFWTYLNGQGLLLKVDGMNSNSTWLYGYPILYRWSTFSYLLKSLLNLFHKNFVAYLYSHCIDNGNSDYYTKYVTCIWNKVANYCLYWLRLLFWCTVLFSDSHKHNRNVIVQMPCCKQLVFNLLNDKGRQYLFKRNLIKKELILQSNQFPYCSAGSGIIEYSVKWVSTTVIQIK